MKTIRKILVPVDFTETSKTLLQHAVNFANRYHAEIILLHVYNRPLTKRRNKAVFEKGIVHALDHALLSWKEKRIEVKFKNLMADVSNIYDTRFTLIKEIGLLSECIKKVINRYGVDLVVMGTKHAQDNLSLWSSKAAKLTNKLHVPILILPYHFQFDRELKIAFAYDLKKINDLENLNVIKMFSSFFDAKIHLFTVSHGVLLTEEEKQNLQILKDHFEGYDLEFHTVKSSDVETGILSFTENHQVSILTLLHRSTNLFKGIFHKSIAKSVAKKADVPVLSIEDK